MKCKWRKLTAGHHHQLGFKCHSNFAIFLSCSACLFWGCPNSSFNTAVDTQVYIFQSAGNKYDYNSSCCTRPLSWSCKTAAHWVCPSILSLLTGNPSATRISICQATLACRSVNCWASWCNICGTKSENSTMTTTFTKGAQTRTTQHATEFNEHLILAKLSLL